MQVNALNCSAVYLLECNQPLTGSFCLTIRILAQEELNKLDSLFIKLPLEGKYLLCSELRGLEGNQRGWKSVYSHNKMLTPHGHCLFPVNTGHGPKSLTSGDCSSVTPEKWSVDQMHLLPTEPAPA